MQSFRGIDWPPPRYFALTGTNDALFGFIAVPIRIIACPERVARTPSCGPVFYVSRIRSAGRDVQGDEVVSKTADDKTPRRDEKKNGGGERDVGEALRAVYHDAVSESVPDVMLDLLKKLG